MQLKRLEDWMDFPINHSHEVYMKRALELANNGCGRVSPNPLVGCVIVHDGRIIGEGWHKRYGGPHAEVNAIEAVAEKGLLKTSTLYVNLEPCSHAGKTPPCADLLIKHQIPKVIIANQDINPLVSGKGINKLRDAGLTVITDVLFKEGWDLNKRFFTYMKMKRPHIILKWAETADGFIARTNKDSKWISDDYSRQLVHKWRSEEDAVLVGSATAWHDNPTLNVRDWSGRDPMRIIIDRYLKVSPSHHLFDGKQKTVCYNVVKDEEHQNLSYVRLTAEKFLQEMIQHLYRQNIQSIIVEGGGQILNAFITTNLWDEARIFTSPQTFGQGIPAPKISGVLLADYKLGADRLKIIAPHHHCEAISQESSLQKN